MLHSVRGQTNLEPGDIAIIGFNSTTWDNPGCNTNNDNFSFVPLVDIESGTIVYFSDCGVKTSGCFRDTEGFIKWEAPVSGVLKGTIVSIDVKDNSCIPNIIRGSGTVTELGIGAGFDLNVNGEQIIVFQDNDGVFSGGCIDDEFIFAFTNNVEWQTDATSSNTSALPPGLTDGVNAISLPKNPGFQNNALFDCSKVGSGTKEEILESITDSANWMGNSSTIYDLPDCIFSFTGLKITYLTYNQMQLDWPDPGSTDEMIIVAKQDTLISVNPSGNDGSTWTESTVFASGTDIGDNSYIVYKGVSVAPDTSIIVTQLTEGKKYYFKIFTHIIGSSTWTEGGTSSPEYAIATVQDVSDVSLSLSGTKDISANWTNYIGNPQASWWDGGTMIIGKSGSTVMVSQTDLNSLSNAASDFTLGQDLSAFGGNFSGAFVAGIDLTGSPGASENLLLANSAVCQSFYYKIFHNDGDISNEDRWSEGIDMGSVTTLCPEIKIEGNNIEIADGDITPEYTDNTNFGAILESTTLSRTFKIKNTGTGELTLSGVPKVSVSGTVFSITALPVSPVASSSESLFQITFSAPNNCPGSPYTETVSIVSDDSDENPYTFSIRGTCNNNCASLSPVSGTEGTTVIITGSGFSGSTTVTFNGTSATVVSWTATTLEVKVPTGATTGTVSLTSPAINSCSVFTIISAAGTCIH